MSSEPVQIGSIEFRVVVQPLIGGDFTFALVEIDRAESAAKVTRFHSHLRFGSESEAFEGGCAQIRLHVKKARV